MLRSGENPDSLQMGHSCRRLWMEAFGAPGPGAAKHGATEHRLPAPLLSLIASVLLGFACASAALAATTAGQAHGLPVATHLPSYLLSDKHPMALALLALVILLVLGRGYYLYRVLSHRHLPQGIGA